MDNLVATYEDEWAVVVKGAFGPFYEDLGFLKPNSTDPARRKQFKQFVNTSERVNGSELIEERGQRRPADWPKAFPPVSLTPDAISTPKSQWNWVKVAGKADLLPNDSGTTSAAIKYGETQLAIYHVPQRGYYATQQM